jgi:hypothetical protein
MKNFFLIIPVLVVVVAMSGNVFSQSEKLYKELGIDVGGFTNFPANQDYLTKNMSAIYVAPYLRIGRHEVMAGINYPVPADGLYFTDVKLNGRPGVMAGYKLYLFNPFGRENMFVHYSFQYLNFKGGENETYEKDRYFNNAIGLGYNLFFDSEARFGLFYILDYVISQTGFNRFSNSGSSGFNWTNNWAWNHLSTHIGLSFKLAELKNHSKN